MSKAHKKMFAKTKSILGTIAKPLTISFYPEHVATMTRRGQELNLSRSIMIQLLWEIEERDGLLRRELIKRLSEAPTSQPLEASHD